jgi:hypothetical protein
MSVQICRVWVTSNWLTPVSYFLPNNSQREKTIQGDALIALYSFYSPLGYLAGIISRIMLLVAVRCRVNFIVLMVV